MKTKIYIFSGIFSIFSIIALGGFAKAQTWSVDFGTAVGSFESAQGVNTTLLPQPVPMGGALMLSVGAVAQGSGFFLENPGLPLLGSGSELRATASTGVAVNKFSVYGYSPSKMAYASFPVLFGNESGQAGPKSGEWYFYMGSGQLFSNTANASTTLGESFISFRWTFAPGGQMKLAYHDGTDWVNLSLTLPGGISQARIYNFEFYGNNTSLPADYFKGGMHNLGADRWDLWIDGVKVATQLKGGGLANDVEINAFLFGGERSTVNFSTIFLDDMIYSNLLPSAPLPVEMVSFDGESREDGIILEWVTATETNNDFFTVERSMDGKDFSVLQQIPGAGTDNKVNEYNFRDTEAGNGLFYYRIKQTDFDGAFTYSRVISVVKDAPVENLLISGVHASAQSVDVWFNGDPGVYTAAIYDLNGRLLTAQESSHSGGSGLWRMEGQTSGSGIYILHFGNSDNMVSARFFMD